MDDPEPVFSITFNVLNAKLYGGSLTSVIVKVNDFENVKPPLSVVLMVMVRVAPAS